jgi:hypothetical protein
MASVKGLGSSVVGRVCLLALASLLPVVALADGMVIPERAFAIPQIPDQQALIHYANGTETLVIETSFTGQGSNFAWVVPLPAVAKIEPASTGLFPTLQTIFQPKVVLSVRHYWIALPIAALVVWLIRFIRRESFFGLLVLGLLLLLAMLLLPALAPAKSRAGAPESTVASVRVLNRQTAGLFETVTIQSADPSALVNWLNENRFRAPTHMAPVIADYVCALLFMALVLGWLLLSRIKRGFQAAKWAPWLAPVAVTTGMVVYFLAVPKVTGASFRTTRVSFGGAYNDSLMLAMALGDELQASNVVQSAVMPVPPLTQAEAARLLQVAARDLQRRGLSQSRSHSPLTNLFTGDPIRFEASPGNVLLRAVAQPGGDDRNQLFGAAADAYELVWHDLDGVEAITNLVPPWRDR